MDTITLTITGKTWGEIWAKIDGMKSWDTTTTTTTTAPTTEWKEPTKKGPGRPKKTTTEEVDTTDDFEGDTAPTLSMEDDVLPAFREYAEKHSKEEARKILARFKVKGVRELPPTKWSEALAMLG